MFWKSKKENSGAKVNWNELNAEAQLEELLEESNTQPVLIYKHSTRCGISSMTLNRLESDWDEAMNGIRAYFLDLIAYRMVSNAVAEKLGVMHQSPQVILLRNGKVIHDASHMEISAQRIKKNSDLN